MSLNKAFGDAIDRCGGHAAQFVEEAVVLAHIKGPKRRAKTGYGTGQAPPNRARERRARDLGEFVAMFVQRSDFRFFEAVARILRAPADEPCPVIDPLHVEIGLLMDRITQEHLNATGVQKLLKNRTTSIRTIQRILKEYGASASVGSPHNPPKPGN